MHTYTHSHIFYLTKKKESRSQQGYPTLPRARELTQIGVKDPESYLLSLFFCSALFFFLVCLFSSSPTATEATTSPSNPTRRYHRIQF